MNLFDLVATIRVDLGEFEGGLAQAQQKAGGFAQSLDSWGQSTAQTGKSLTKWLTAPTIGLGTAIVKTGADYEAGMSKVQAISGATGEDLDMLKDKSMEMASQTKFSTAEAAEAYQYMAMAGWDARQMADGLPGVMLLAAASGEDLASTSDIVTDALTAFGMTAADSGRFADVLAAASNSANTNVSMLGESFKYVAPVAGALGYSAEDTSLALGLMANSGIKASQSGTALRSILTRMAKPTKDSAAAMDLLGVSITDEEGNMYSLKEIMDQLRNSFAGGRITQEEYAESAEKLNQMLADGSIDLHDYAVQTEALDIALNGVGEAQQAELAAMLAGQEAMGGLLAIVNAAPADYEKLAAAIGNSAGTTQQMADVMNDNAAGAMAMLSSAINVLFTNLGEFLIPAFTELVRWLTDCVNWFNGLDDGVKKIVLTLGGAAAAAGPVLIVIGKIASGLSAVGGAISGVIGFCGKLGGAAKTLISGLSSGLKGLFTLITNHPVIAAITAIAAGLVYLWENCEWFREMVQGLLEWLGEAVSALWEWLKGVGEAIAQGWSAFMDWVGEKARQAWEGIKEAWSAAVEFFSALGEGIKAAWQAALEAITGFFQGAWEAIQGAWSAAVEFFSALGEGIKTAWQAAWQEITGFFQAAWEGIKEIWNGAVEFFTGLCQGIQEIFSAAAQAISGFLKEAWQAVKEAWGETKEFFVGIWNGIKEIFSAAKEFFGQVFQQAWQAIQDAWSDITGFFTETWEKIKKIFTDGAKQFLSIGKNMVTGLWKGIKSKIDWLRNKVKGVVSSIKNLFTGRDGFDEHSPSKWAQKVFAFVLEGGGQGLSQAAPGLLRQTSDVTRRVKDSLTPAEMGLELPAWGGGAKAAKGDAPALQARGGDTYNFYSPKALDPVSAAREMKKARQQLAMDLI